jgi:hypothetical protein
LPGTVSRLRRVKSKAPAFREIYACPYIYSLLSRLRGTARALRGMARALRGMARALRGTARALRGTARALRGTARALWGTPRAWKRYYSVFYP